MTEVMSGWQRSGHIVGRWLTPAAWFAQLLIVWLLAEYFPDVVCLNGPGPVVHLVNVAAVVAGGIGLTVTWRSTRHRGEEEARFLDSLALLLSGLFMVAIVLSALFASLLPCR